MSHPLSEVLANLNPADVTVDASGRIVPKNPTLAKKILEAADEVQAEAPGNYNCGCAAAAEQ
ncbi:hypothetical protein ACFVH0_39960 [Streptomyces sp. NPDC127117]|uniref:hypothetical protein n=1 Tax=Streptomyces sp. NPDC127117 TaxID=3345368 RepID=UPI003644327E